jgi:hypothetical protein
VIKAGVRPVQHPKAVFAWLDIEIGKGNPVDTGNIAEELGDPHRMSAIGRRGMVIGIEVDL